MRRKSITFKLFIITTFFFILFLLMQAFSQSMFFEGFYIRHKISQLEKNVMEFSQKYRKEAWGQATVTKNINQFINENNAQVVILNENGAAKHMASFNLVLETEEHEVITVLINNMNMLELIQQSNLKPGDTVAIRGVYGVGKNNLLYPYSISSNNQRDSLVVAANSVTLNDDPIDRVALIRGVKPEPTQKVVEAAEAVEMKTEILRINMQEIKGTIIELNLPEHKDYLLPFRENMLWSAIDNWFWLSKTSDFSLEQDQIISYQYVNPLNGIENIVLVKPIFENGVLKEMIFALSSLQPVGEAMKAMKAYYIYGFIGALLIILLLSYIYSRLIAHPLIKINDVAIKMAELDFSVQCDVMSDDEIGNLASSLNVLSTNLKNNMETLKDTNERLKIEIEKERGLERMRKEFVSSVSHELKTPLGIMRGFTEGLKDGVAMEKRDYYFDVLLDEIEKMDALVLDMLDLSKLESKAYELFTEEFDILALIDTIVNRFKQQLEDKSIKLHINDSHCYWVMADKRRIEQVIVNILTNALRHTDYKRSIDIVIKEEGANILLEIENEGKPIPHDKLKHIWDRFYRVEASRNRQAGGTGLGLSIVKNILELHNSEFGVMNTVKGVKFYFTLKKCVE